MMFRILASVLVLSAFGCSHAQKTNQTTDQRSPSSDNFGEKLFFGDGNVVQDQYGDTQVILCSPGKWIVTHDPNYCGRARARGAAGCTELPAYTSGPMAVEFTRGNYYLTGKEERNGRGAEKHEIHSIGNNQYSIRIGIRGEPVTIQRSKQKIDPSLLMHFCD